ncbi:MAG: hypothetical protein ACK41E_09315 [Deinococcales bacterium]
MQSLRRYIEKHSQKTGMWILGAVLAVLAFDRFIGFGGENLIGLRLVYLLLLFVVLFYIFAVHRLGER